MHSMLMYGALKGIKHGNAAINKNVVRQVAQMLTSDHPRVATAMRIIAQNPRLLAAIRHADAAVGGLVGRTAAPVIHRHATQ
jgi:hypothetical protein